MTHFDTGSIITISITFILFGLALFTTGFTHDLLLEAGVFLISVKLIIMGYKASVNASEVRKTLLEIKTMLENQANSEKNGSA